MRRPWLIPLAATIALLPSGTASADVSADAYPVPATPVTTLNTTLVTNTASAALYRNPEPFDCTESGDDTVYHKSVWFRVTGTGGPVHVTTGDSNYDTVLNVFPANGDGTAGP